MNIIQFGDGNFIRGFIDYMYQKVSRDVDVSIYSIQSRATGKGAAQLRQQNCSFHLLEAGLVSGTPQEQIYLIDVIKDAINPYETWDSYMHLLETQPIAIVFSNTTEAGIVNLHEAFTLEESCVGYPAKLVQLLYIQYKSGFAHPISVLPLELIQENGQSLKALCEEIINSWELELPFVTWFKQHVSFYNTLVDRIVSGYPANKDLSHLPIKFEDPLLTQVEPFYLFAIEADESLDRYLQLKESNPQVVYTNQLSTIAHLKIELLNATHTMLANLGISKGLKTVREAVEDEALFGAVQKIVREGTIPTSSYYFKQDGEEFFADVLQRFRNPFINHYLTDIRLNNQSKMMSRLNPIVNRIVVSGRKDLIEAIAEVYKVAYQLDTSKQQVSPTELIEFYQLNEALAGNMNLFSTALVTK